jgi:hypothetical protein
MALNDCVSAAGLDVAAVVPPALDRLLIIGALTLELRAHAEQLPEYLRCSAGQAATQRLIKAVCDKDAELVRVRAQQQPQVGAAAAAFAATDRSVSSDAALQAAARTEVCRRQTQDRADLSLRI